MNANTPTPHDNEDLAPEQLMAEEEDFSSGNRRLALIVAAIVAVVVLGYVLLPAQATRRLAAAMPVMELGEATVTGAREPAAPATAPAATEQQEEEKATKTAAAKPAAAATRTAAAPADDLPAVATATTPEPAAIEPVPAAAPAPEAAPSTVTMTGRILDENGRPMAGATVMLRGSKKVAGTDANGNYTLEVPAGTDNTLVYGYGGYEDHEVRTRSAQPQNITLLPKEGTTRRRR